MHGQGTQKYTDGRIFMGNFKNDKKSGIGIYLWQDGRAYNGGWKDGKQHGVGFYMTVDQNNNKNIIKKGAWSNGKRKHWIEDLSQREINE